MSNETPVEREVKSWCTVFGWTLGIKPRSSASVSKYSTSAPPLVPQNVSFQRFLFEPFLFPIVSFPTVSKVWETFFRASNSSSQLKRGFKRLQHLWSSPLKQNSRKKSFWQLEDQKDQCLKLALHFYVLQFASRPRSYDTICSSNVPTPLILYILTWDLWYYNNRFWILSDTLFTWHVKDSLFR